MKNDEAKLKEHFSAEAGRRISAAMRAKAEGGVMPGCAPLGYRNAWVDGEKVIVIDPETAPKLRRLFELAAKKKMSVRKLAAEVETMGLRSRNGKKLGPSAIHAILNNPFYVGMFLYEGRILSGRHAALVGSSQFEEVAVNLFRRRK